MLALIAALSVLLPIFLITAPSAQATDTTVSTPTDAQAMAWTPKVSPFSGGQERVHRNVSTETRNRLLANCGLLYLCVAAGEGDGQHSVFELYYCTERTLSNFLGAGAVTNNQTGKSARLLNQDRSVYMTVKPNRTPTRVPSWDTVYYIQVC
ncbi:hypothetical protein [Sphaerisporangium sp. TRM90804]|uniref:hypothetical protein n=1 Tax=Sphaerisporangium sp. TRM90804 TaxID=3031113 RepID=UPI00244C7E2B|nr:hypothetical protein [Sphaerisporangium sp. TRM90804]MDH2429690.1 hypothetical protein [Sphaerisporangium sp. TRM90804]